VALWEPFWEVPPVFDWFVLVAALAVGLLTVWNLLTVVT
jgi:hypothetical protein